MSFCRLRNALVTSFNLASVEAISKQRHTLLSQELQKRSTSIPFTTVSRNFFVVIVLTLAGIAGAVCG